MRSIKTLIEANRSGERCGVPSFCTANKQVIEAVMAAGLESDGPVLIEATCNQVNQEGGYTGLTPVKYRDWVHQLAETGGLPIERLILGSDHLGPNPWRREVDSVAMEKARELVKLYVEAGYTKIHLDASMALGGEKHPSFETVAARAADLCSVAERFAPHPKKLVYVVGTEVPIPGGETDEPAALDVTSVDRLERTIATHKEAFDKAGVGSAWDRVASIVTQPGVDFGHTSIYDFVPDAVGDLRSAILSEPGLTFEAHSTDYQPTSTLGELVVNNFFFLKVGPELTFKFREAVFALAAIETELRPADPSRIVEKLERVMGMHPEYWDEYYKAQGDALKLLQRYSYSDRIRYYWNFPEVQSALAALMANLDGVSIPDGLALQYFGAVPYGEIDARPASLVERHIRGSVERYMSACGMRSA